MAKRDMKDPMPTADNSQRKGKDGGGNTSVSGETHGWSGSQYVTAKQNRSGSGVGPSQPTRQGGGNTSVTGESHDQSKSEHITESQRW